MWQAAVSDPRPTRQPPARSSNTREDQTRRSHPSLFRFCFSRHRLCASQSVRGRACELGCVKESSLWFSWSWAVVADAAAGSSQEVQGPVELGGRYSQEWQKKNGRQRSHELAGDQSIRSD